MSNYYIETDPAGQPIAPLIILANKNGKKIGVLNIDEKSLVIKVELEDAQILNSELSCDVHKYINTHFNPLWDSIRNFKLICVPISIPHIKAKNLWYEIEVSIDENDETVKHLTGTLAQYKELSQSYNYEIEIRTEEDMARDDYKDTVFYNPDDPEASIVDRVLHDKAKHYYISHVDDSLWNVKRSFSFNGVSILDCLQNLAEEVDCIIILGESSTNDEDIIPTYERTISFYDAKDYCPACGSRGDFTNGCTNPECDHSQKIIPRYGQDTGIFISHENLGENITMSVNTDNIKNCFRVTAGDDDMTAAVILCNPSGSRYIWRFTDEMKADMSPELYHKYSQYETEYNMYKYNYNMSLVSRAADYNELYDKYESRLKEKLGHIARPIIGYTNLTTAYYYSTFLRDFLKTTMFPDSPDVVDTTAEEEMAKFTIRTVGVRSLSSLSKSTTATEVEDLAKVYVDDARYSVEAITTTYEDKRWTGTLTLTSYTDDKDTYTAILNMTFTQATAEFLKDQVDKYIKRKEAIVSGAKELLKLELNDFKKELPKYNLDFLIDLRSVVESVLLMLDDANVNIATAPDVYNEIYVPYSQKKDALTAEIQIREEEVDRLNLLIEQIEQQQNTINTALNLEEYLGNDLWLELLSFRRETDQSDDTIISQGLSDAEIIENALEFYKRADEDIDKLTESIYEIDCDLKDLLLMLPETYSQLKGLFDVGNWLRVEIDDKVYKLRLLSYEIDFGDLTTIQTSFATAKRSNSIASTFKQLKKNANTTNQKVADISKQVKINEISNDIINQITTYSYNPDGALVANIKGETVIINEDTTLKEYLQRIIQDVNGNLAIILSNEFEGIVTDEDGNNGDYSTCYTDVHIYFGNDEITDDTNVIWDVYIPPAATGIWDTTKHQIKISDTTEDVVVIEVFATYKELEVKKNFVIKKIKQSSSPVIVNIESSAGNIFKNNTINTTLTCTVTQGDRDITSTVTNFHWVKYDSQGNIDTSWSRGNVSSITLTSADITGKAVFRCEVTI